MQTASAEVCTPKRQYLCFWAGTESHIKRQATKCSTECLNLVFDEAWSEVWMYCRQWTLPYSTFCKGPNAIVLSTPAYGGTIVWQNKSFTQIKSDRVILLRMLCVLEKIHLNFLTKCGRKNAGFRILLTFVIMKRPFDKEYQITKFCSISVFNFFRRLTIALWYEKYSFTITKKNK